MNLNNIFKNIHKIKEKQFEISKIFNSMLEDMISFENETKYQHMKQFTSESNVKEDQPNIDESHIAYNNKKDSEINKYTINELDLINESQISIDVIESNYDNCIIPLKVDRKISKKYTQLKDNKIKKKISKNFSKNDKIFHKFSDKYKINNLDSTNLLKNDILNQNNLKFESDFKKRSDSNENIDEIDKDNKIRKNINKINKNRSVQIKNNFDLLISDSKLKYENSIIKQRKSTFEDGKLKQNYHNNEIMNNRRKTFDNQNIITKFNYNKKYSENNTNLNYFNHNDINNPKNDLTNEFYIYTSHQSFNDKFISISEKSDYLNSSDDSLEIDRNKQNKMIRKSIKQLKNVLNNAWESESNTSGNFEALNSLKTRRSRRRNSTMNLNEETKFIAKNQEFDDQDEIRIFNRFKDSKIYINRDSNYLISESSQFILSWNQLILLILIFQIIFFPFENYSEKWLSDNIQYIQINLLCEYIFILDIPINFITTQRDIYGNEIKKSSQIIQNYCSGWFIIDLISSIPVVNLEQQVNIDINMFGSGTKRFIKQLKFPKQIRIIRAIINIFGSKVQSWFNLSSMFLISTTELNKRINSIKQFVIFILISNYLVCQMIHLVNHCNYNFCNTWFFSLMQEEYQNALNSPGQDKQHLNAVNFQEISSSEYEAQIRFQNQCIDQKYYLYLNAWQFIIQTVTTVGQGDVGTVLSSERMFRAICMIIGVILFTLLSSSVLENMISETLNIYSKNEHEAMIEKMMMKYDMVGDSKRFLSLLGDSVQTESLCLEINFAKLLPRKMYEEVLKFMWKLYYNKLQILHEENMGFFLNMMKIAQFRRCVFDEVIDEDEYKISLVYSGQIGCYIASLRQYMMHDYLQYKEVGQEMGFNCFINFKLEMNNYVQTCTVNTELVEIKSTNQIELLKTSLKGLNYIFEKVKDQLFDIYIMISLQYSMKKLGHYIDMQFQNKMIKILKFKPQDFQIMEKLFSNYTSIDFKQKRIQGKDLKSLSSNWWNYIVNNDQYKQINSKSINLADDLILEDQIELYTFIKNKKFRKI